MHGGNAVEDGLDDVGGECFCGLVLMAGEEAGEDEFVAGADDEGRGGVDIGAVRNSAEAALGAQVGGDLLAQAGAAGHRVGQFAEPVEHAGLHLLV